MIDSDSDHKDDKDFKQSINQSIDSDHKDDKEFKRLID
jgi:hypothetical protein